MATLGERLKMARALAGLPLREAAARAGVSHMAISKYERGLDIPSSAVLLRLAAAFGVRMDYFFRSGAVALEGVRYRCRSGCGAHARERVQGEVIECLERGLQVQGLFGASEPFAAPQIAWEAADLQDIERIAQELRAAWHLGLDAIENLTDTLEDRGIHVCLVQGDEGFDGLSAWTGEGTPVIAARRDIPGDRQRFNLAHELAHLFLRLPPELKDEAAAHRFAGAFLAPEPTARRELGERRRDLNVNELHLLKYKYGLSMQAWVRRAWDLRIIEETTYLRLCRQFSQSGWRKVEPGDQLPSEVPQRLKRQVFRALAEDVISRSRAIELLGKQPAELVGAVA